jgi:hypothetical protein
LKRGLIDASAIFEAVERLQVDGQVLGSMAGVVKSAFGNTADQRHLAAFETDSNGAARPCGLAFATAAAGLSMAAGFALAEPLTAVFGSRTRFKVV